MWMPQATTYCMAVMPVFEGSELVARGVHMMAESVEDGGEGVAFNVFCYNVQPGVVIDYGTGESMLEEDATLPDVSGAESAPDTASEGAGAGEASEKGATGSAEGKGTTEYVLNTNSKKFHLPSCSSVDQIEPQEPRGRRGHPRKPHREGLRPLQALQPVGIDIGKR